MGGKTEMFDISWIQLAQYTSCGVRLWGDWWTFGLHENRM